ncbi:hypothetical protein, partial [Limosilactobacillus fermentum]|uniref:hypothetical protein n=1 Tax=Limosilactobacillus fermentum TaxID=1613 RepID=UPI0021A675A9
SAKEKALSCFKEAIHPPLVEVGVFSPIMDKTKLLYPFFPAFCTHFFYNRTTKIRKDVSHVPKQSLPR